MQEEIKKATLPIIHYGLDLWTCKLSGLKYLGIHVFYVDSNFQLRHALLSVSEVDSHTTLAHGQLDPPPHVRPCMDACVCARVPACVYVCGFVPFSL